MSDRTINIVLVAVGGYGMTYVHELLDRSEGHNARIVGAVDPFADKCDRLDELVAQGVYITDSLEDFYANHTADLTVISSPIQFHASQSITAMEHGSHVLCEKPAAATVEETQRMIETSDRTGKFLAIGYQASFHPATTAIKRMILSGAFGRPTCFKAVVGWPRFDSYYQRAGWAGRIQLDDGRAVYDSPANNATSHYLHNLLFLLGEQPHTAAQLKTIEAELYRAKPIENYDTAMMRAMTHDHVEILFYTSHSTHPGFGPFFELNFENANLIYTHDSLGRATFHTTFKNGLVEQYPGPPHGCVDKLWHCVKAARDGQSQQPILCDIRTAAVHTQCINTLQHTQTIHDIDASYLARETKDGDELIYVQGMREVMMQCYEQQKLPAELGDAPWAVAGQPADVHATA